MTYQQLVTPNLDPIVYQSGTALTDWLGWCLAVAWTAFSGKTTNPTAWDAWTNSLQYKHTDALPSGVFVPVWFSGFGGSGHVAIYKDGKVWSSPYSHKAIMDVLSSIAQVEQFYGVKYVGWSEDIGSVRVVQLINQGEDMATDNQIDEWISTQYQIAFNQPPSDAVFTDWRGVLKNNFVEGSISILKGIDTNAGALKNRPAPTADQYVPFTSPPLFTKK